MLETRHSAIDFIGRDGFHWFLGQVTPDKAWRDKNNQNFQNGFRAKVRIFGHHPKASGEEGGIDDVDLPWAHFLTPPNFGAGNNFGGTSFALQGGEWVFGFFLDGEEAQQPVVLGCFHNNSSTETEQSAEDVINNGTTGFAPYIFPKEIEKGDPITLVGNEPNDPVSSIATSDAKVLNDKKEEKGTIAKHFDNKTYEVKTHQKCYTPKGAMGEVAKELQNFIGITQGLEKYKDAYIDPVVNKFVNMDKLVDKFSIKIAGGMSGVVREARKQLFHEINKNVDAAVGFLDPAHLIKNLEIKKQTDAIYCLIENFLKGLKNFVGDFLKELLGKLVNAPLCLAEKFIGGLMSSINDTIQNMINGPVNALSKLAGITIPSFSSMMSKAVGIAQAGLALLQCEGNECEPSPNDWVTNLGPDPKKVLDFNNALSISNGLSGFNPAELSTFMDKVVPGISKVTGLISKVTGVKDQVTSMGMEMAGAGDVAKLVGACNPFEKKCGPPRIELFGGGGIGAIANGVINSVGKVVGVNMKDLGLGFTDPPKVRFIDDCGNGAGATGEAVIDSETGEVTNIIITDPGGGYLGPEDVADSDGEDVVGFVSGIQVISTGAGYQEGDTITVEDTGAGPCTIIPQIFDGKIVGGSGGCGVGITDIPKLTINTRTGSGARIRPITKFIKREEFTGELPPNATLIRVIDCPRIY